MDRVSWFSNPNTKIYKVEKSFILGSNHDGKEKMFADYFSYALSLYMGSQPCPLIRNVQST